MNSRPLATTLLGLVLVAGLISVAPETLAESRVPPPAVVPFDVTRIAGNWRVEINDSVAGRIEGEISFKKDRGWNRPNFGDWFRSAYGEERVVLQNLSITGSELHAGLYAPGLFPVGKSVQRHMKVRFSPDGQSATGTMQWGDEAFASVTMNKMVPRLTGRVLPGKAPQPGGTLDILLEGSGLPHHVYFWFQLYDVQIDDPWLIFQRVYLTEGGWRLRFRLDRPLTAGRKIISINGGTVPVDILVDKAGGSVLAGPSVPLAAEPETASITDPDTGITTTSARNDDGSRTVVHTDAAGHIVGIDTLAPGDTGAGSLTFTDPDTGITKTIIRDGDGHRSVLESVASIDPAGGASVFQVDPFGQQTDILALPEGTVVVQKRDLAGNERTTIAFDDGSRATTTRTALGQEIETLEDAGGVAEVSVRDADGRLIATTLRNEDGGATTTDAEGRTVTVSPPGAEGTMAVVETDRRGNRTRSTYLADGTAGERVHERAADYEPGEDYYTNSLQGNIPWEDLDAGDRKRFADSEAMMRNRRDAMDLQQAQADERARQKAAQQARFADLDASLDKQLAAIQAEQADADREALARKDWLELQRQRDEASEKMKALDTRIKWARKQGDLETARRLEAEHDTIHDATLDLFAPTDVEQAEIDRKQNVRDALLDEVGRDARQRADAAYRATESAQDRAEAITGLTRYVSAGSEMQHAVAATNRLAQREKAGAEGWFQAIENKLKDPATTPEERDILADMARIARLRQEGGERLLDDNARIVAAGYAVDGALLVSGGALKVAAAAGEQLVVKAMVTSAARNTFAEQIAGGASRAAATRAAKAAGERVAADALARAAATKAALAESRIGQMMLKQRELPGAVTAITDKFVSRQVADVAAVNAIAGATVDTGLQLARTGTIDPVETIRAAAQGAAVAGVFAAAHQRLARPGKAKPAPSGREARPGATTIDDPAAGRDTFVDNSPDLPPGPAERPIGALSGGLTTEQIAVLHEPGRNLTPQEIMLKSDLYRERIRLAKAVNRGADAGRTRSEMRDEIQALLRQHRRIQRGVRQAASPLVKTGASSPPPGLGAGRTQGSWSETPTLIDANRRASPGGTERFDGATPPPPGKPPTPPPSAGQPHETRVLDTPPTHAAPGDATTILDAQGRPIRRADGTLATTDRPPNQTVRLKRPPIEAGPDESTIHLDAKGRPVVRPEAAPGAPRPNQTLRLPGPQDLAGPNEATTILDAQGRPVLHPDGRVATTADRPAANTDSPPLRVEELLPEDLASTDSAQDSSVPVVEELVPDHPVTPAAMQANPPDEQLVRAWEQAFREESRIRQRALDARAQARAQRIAEAMTFKPPPGGKLRRANVHHLVKGEAGRVGALMKDTGYSATQAHLYANTVNAYAQRMIDGSFNWHDIPASARIAFDAQTGKIVVQGHHRFVAARIAADLTGRPLMGGSRPIIPKEGITEPVAIDAGRKVSFEMDVREGFKPPDPTTTEAYGTGGTADLR